MGEPNSKLRVAVIGPGRAGRARIRALEASPRAELAAVVGREAKPRFEEVLEDPSIDAAIVCTPNCYHPAMARALVAAGKHTAVEFPLAPGVAEARGLFRDAAAAGRVLHVEHIELLAPGHLEMRERRGALGRPRGGTVSMAGDSGGWIGDDALAGSPGLRAVSRLHRIVDLFGEARVRSAALERQANRYRLEVHLEFEAGGGLTLEEVRGPGVERALTWDVRCDGGLLEEQRRRAGPLFEEDLGVFLARIAGTGVPYVSEERILHVLGLVEQIDAATSGRRGSR